MLIAHMIAVKLTYAQTNKQPKIVQTDYNM